jgi:hypothetical protein
MLIHVKDSTDTLEAKKLELFRAMLYYKDGGEDFVRYFPYKEYHPLLLQIQSKFNNYCNSIDEWYNKNK